MLELCNVAAIEIYIPFFSEGNNKKGILLILNRYINVLMVACLIDSMNLFLPRCWQITAYGGVPLFQQPTTGCIRIQDSAFRCHSEDRAGIFLWKAREITYG